MEKILENKKSIALALLALGLGFALATLNNSKVGTAGAAGDLPVCVEGTGGGSVTDAGSVTKAIETATGGGDSTKTVTKTKTKTINSSTNTNSNQVLSDVVDVQVNDVLNENEVNVLNDLVDVGGVDVNVTDTVDSVIDVAGSVTGSLLN